MCENHCRPVCTRSHKLTHAVTHTYGIVSLCVLINAAARQNVWNAFFREMLGSELPKLSDHRVGCELKSLYFRNLLHILMVVAGVDSNLIVLLINIVIYNMLYLTPIIYYFEMQLWACDKIER